MGHKQGREYKNTQRLYGWENIKRKIFERS